MKRLSIIVAASVNNIIGADGGLPWRLPEDLKRFREVTMGKPIIMGRSTWESIGRALPGRISIIVTRQAGYEAEGSIVVESINAAMKAAGDAEEVMVIGGGEIYRQFLPQADRIYLTRVLAEVTGDTTFPELDLNEWSVVSVGEYPVGDEREIGFEIETLDRRR